jgi:PAS domain S-box-containing protein
MNTLAPSSEVLAPRGRFVGRAWRFSRYAGGMAVAIGASVLVGWALDIGVLKSAYGTITMKANAAVTIVLAGISLILLHAERASVLKRRVAIACAAAVTTIALLTVSQHLTGWNLGIDEILVREGAGAVATASPGRMGPSASTCLALLGITLILAHRRRAITTAQSLCVAVLLWSLLAIIGYLYGAAPLYTVTQATAIALHTALTLFILAIGVLAALADTGFVAAISSDREGGLMARRAMLAAAVAPIALGWIAVWLESHGMLDEAFGAAMLVVAIVVIITVVISHGAVRLNRESGHRLLAEATIGEQEDRLRQLTTLIDLSYDPILVWEIDGGIVEWNAGCERLYGYSRDEVLGRGSALLLADEGAETEAMRLSMRERLERHRHWSGEVRHRTRDGRVVAVESRQQLMVTDGRRLVLETNRDITERAQFEQERDELLRREQRARLAAEESARLKDEFLATVSHELRTPLNAILGWVTLLRMEESDPPTVESALETIERNARIQAELVNDILDVSRIVAGKLQIDRRTLELGAVMESAIATIAPAAEAKQQRLDIALGEPGLTLAGDADRLQQVVWNLLANAVKFTPVGGSIRIAIERSAAHARIVVADSGSGIPPEFLPFVFERFLQADGSRTRRHGGLGLGLSIARYLVELHGGTIAAASDGVDKGATFTIELPLGDGALEQRPAVDVATLAPAERDGERRDGLQGVSILVVDDEEDARDVLRGILEHHGATVSVAAGAGEAMIALESSRPRLLICDIGMPDEDGYSLIRRVRKLGAEHGGSVPAIALTGYARSEERARALDAGFHHFLAKPVDAGALVDVIAGVLDGGE